MTNETFASTLCGLLPLLAAGQIRITNPNCSYVLLPSCIYNDTITSLDATCVVVGSFNWTSAVALILSNTIFSSGITGSPSGQTPVSIGASAAPGFDSDGKVDWNDLFTTMSNLVSLSISGNLQGSLPSALPLRMAYTELTNTQISGNIPPTMFNPWTGNPSSRSLSFTFSGGLLTGSIPPSLFQPLAGGMVPNFAFTMLNAGLSGTIPPDLFVPLTGMNSFKVSLEGNELTGTIPSELWRKSMFTTTTVFPLSMSLASNQLQGSIPISLFWGLPAPASLYLGSNKLTGSLPSSLLPNDTAVLGSSFILDISNNMVSGTIPKTLLTANLNANLSMTLLQLNFQHNLLEGPIPAELFYTNDTVQPDRGLAPDTRYIVDCLNCVLKFGSNRLGGALPSAAFAPLPTSVYTLSVDLSSNQYVGELKPFFDALTPRAWQFNFYNNSLSGSLPTCATLAGAIADYSYNVLTGTIPDDWFGCDFGEILVAGNIGLVGSFPSDLYGERFVNLNISRTSISGEINSTVSQYSILIDMSYTDIDFCSNDTIASFSSFPAMRYSLATTCSLDHTSACNCSDAYPLCSTSCALEQVPMPTPVPVSPPLATNSPLSAPIPCHGTAPSPAFTCQGGAWHATSVIAPTLVLPQGVGTVLITGNLTSSSIIITGLGSSIEVGGCVTNLSAIQVNLDKTEVESIGNSKTFTLVTTSSNSSCSANFGSIALSATSSDGGCRKVKVMKTVATTPSGGSTLGALFTIDKSSCNTWWIILVSVVCGVIVVAVIVIVLLAVFWPAFREKIRPYSRARKTRQAAV